MIKRTAVHVKKTMYGEGTGHDWWHVYRVWNIAKRIAETEKNAYMEVVELGALLHDIKDWKFSNGDMKAGEKAARDWLESIDTDPEIVDKVCYIVGNVSFKGSGVKDKMKTLEGRIVQDADRIDAIGAIGIARCFAELSLESIIDASVPALRFLAVRIAYGSDPYVKATYPSISTTISKITSPTCLFFLFPFLLSTFSFCCVAALFCCAICIQI